MTGLIYVILIVVWGVVLVPRWLRRHDEAKGIDQAEALEAALGSESVPTGERVPDGAQAATWGEYLRGLAAINLGRYSQRLTFTGSGASPAARRRGKILIGLSGAVVISVLGAYVGVLSGLFAVISTFLFAGYLSAMVYSVRRREAVAIAKRAMQDSSTNVGFGEAVVANGETVDGVRVVGEASDAWEPQQTTLPTYVTKTKASKIPRRIDLTSGWTGADMIAQAREQQASPGLEKQFSREWAAVEPDEDIEVERYADGQEADYRYYRRAVNE